MRLIQEVILAKKKGVSLVSPSDRRLLRQVGSRIREVRESKRQTVYDITGDDMPIRSRQHWQAIESGQKNMNITTAFKVARSLEIRLDELLKGIE